MIVDEEAHLAHYGILRRSGRYPWGSGGTQSKRNKSFLDIVQQHRKEGMSDAEIAKAYNMSRNDLTALRSIALAQQDQEKRLTAQRLRDKGWSKVEIGKRMNMPESSVRALLARGEQDKADALQTTANMLRDNLAKNKYLYVGRGVENQIGVTRTRLDTSIAILKEEGYTVHVIKVPQLGTGKFTNAKILAPPGTTKSDIDRNRKDIGYIKDYSEDRGRSFVGIQKPVSINSKRVKVNYGDEGGAEADGVIYVRPGVNDLRIGSKQYGQVRIAVDGTHYMKGMAVYKDDLPPGVDIIYNTNKKRGTPLKNADPNGDSVFKPMSEDPEFPFGSIVRQLHGPDGKVNSVMNLVGSPLKEGSGEEGQWDTWSKSLSTQFLSKQKPELAQTQLDLTYDRRIREYDEIKSLTNPVVRKKLLERFADETDSAAVHLQAANLRRQATKVILPVPSMKPNEVYAPTMRDGEQVVLVRYPHAGTFEIPSLKVNNKNPAARKLIGTGKDSPRHDAIGIHPSVAHHLSGADFDGDTVLLIPNNNKKITVSPALEGLKNFDPSIYKLPDHSPIPVIDERRKQQEMGKVSNLITDMTIQGASHDELARAVRHSMVVIDARKHRLDFKQSEKDNGIAALKEKYQGGKNRGAATLFSRANAKVHVPEKTLRRASEGGYIDPKTGRKVYVPTGRTVRVRKRVKDPTTGRVSYVDTGKTTDKMIVSRRLAETHDAFTLTSGPPPTRIETIYATHSNKLKSLANQARKDTLTIVPNTQSKSAKKVYASEVASLNAKLNNAKKNAPLEVQAQVIANLKLSQRMRANPNMEPEDVKKIKQFELNEARAKTGAKKIKIVPTPEEWNAIQAGAISTSKLEEMLVNSDLDAVRSLALPRKNLKFNTSMKRRAQQMLKNGYTQAEVADHLGIGLTTLKVGLSE